MLRTVRNSFCTGWPAGAVLFLLTLGGCGGGATNDYQAAAYDPLARDGARYAVGGFVLGPQAELERQSELGAAYRNSDVGVQTDAWAPSLYGALLSGRTGLEVWSWPAVRDNVPADEITALQLAYAAGETLPPAQFSRLAADLPGITYLVLARLDRNEVEIGSNAPGSLGSQVVDDSRDPHGVTDSMARTIKTRRTVVVSLDVYDLRTGRSVWSGHTDRKKTELYSPEDRDEGAELVVTPSEEEGGAPEIRVKGASLAMPELEELLADACVGLVGSLFGTDE